MTDLVERRIGDLTVRIDRQLCVGFGDCIEEAPESFVLDEEGIAVFTDGAGKIERTRLLKACQSCPVDALSVVDADGTPVVS
ncbi:ferredoxin [soil metagenome]